MTAAPTGVRTPPDTALPGPAGRAPGPGYLTAVASVYRAQISRARAARGPLLIVATVQSVGILLLLRGVVHRVHDVTSESIVAGSAMLVVAFVALNLLAQRFGALRASRGLDYYAALPAPRSAVLLGIAAGYASFTLPGAMVTAAVGAALYGLPFAGLWVALPAAVVAGAALAGLGALLGLVLPRPELATLAGQLGMTVVLFLGIIPAGRLPGPVQALRAVVPSTYAVDALAEVFTGHPDWGYVAGHLAVCVAVAAVLLALASRALRRAVRS